MTRIALALLGATLLSGCGYAALDAEAIGQAKKVARVTPLICPDYFSFDVSLGIMRGGTGSMSTQDSWFTVENQRDLDKIRAAVDAGAVVKVIYKARRLAICTDTNVMTGFEVVP